MVCQQLGNLECILFLYTASHLSEGIPRPLHPAEYESAQKLLLCTLVSPIQSRSVFQNKWASVSKQLFNFHVLLSVLEYSALASASA